MPNQITTDYIEALKKNEAGEDNSRDFQETVKDNSYSQPDVEAQSAKVNEDTKVDANVNHPPVSSPVDEKEKNKPEVGAEEASTTYEFVAGDLVANRYSLEGWIGSGSFGHVYRAKDRVSGHWVAVKVETFDRKDKQIFIEKKVYREVGRCDGIPQCRWFGEERNYQAIVIDYLSPSLDQLLHFCGGTFSLKTTLMIGSQMLNRLEMLHRKCYVHRDIKPSNMGMGMFKYAWKVHLFDFGLARQFRNRKFFQHHRYVNQDPENFAGTLRYASINANSGHAQTRRDDLESLLYCLIFFLKGSLPWFGVTASNRKEKKDKVLAMKVKISPEELCAGLPEQLCRYLKHVRSLQFHEDPDYRYLKSLIQGCLQNRGYLFDHDYDWMVRYRFLKAHDCLDQFLNQIKHSMLKVSSAHSFEENLKIYANSSRSFQLREGEVFPYKLKDPNKSNEEPARKYGDVPKTKYDPSEPLNLIPYYMDVLDDNEIS